MRFDFFRIGSKGSCRLGGSFYCYLVVKVGIVF